MFTYVESVYRKFNYIDTYSEPTSYLYVYRDATQNTKAFQTELLIGFMTGFFHKI